jgi:3-deoxy-7-phosphoheptulonate synthase
VLWSLLERIDAGREAGRITFITCLGATAVEASLPKLARAVAASGHRVLWSCDPMHGNTETITSGARRAGSRRVERTGDGVGVDVRARTGQNADIVRNPM